MIDHLSDRGAASSVQESLEVRQALAALPEDHRAVILLVVVEGFTNREAAEILGLPVGTVMSRISRARHSLREKLSACTHSGKEC
jgi:RNA polymerase sigma-70 factor (ECF subfamily)